MQIQLIDQKLKALVKTERKITYEVLMLIQSLDITRNYRELGYPSLFEYLVKEIGYSEGSAHRRISAARLMKHVPQVEEDLKSGNLSLTQVALAQTAIRQEEKAQDIKMSPQRKSEVMEKLKNKNSFETKKILKNELPNFELPASQVMPTGSSKVHVTLEFAEADWEKVQALLAQMSHKVPSQKLEDLLLYWQNYLEKKSAKQKNDSGEQNLSSDAASLSTTAEISNATAATEVKTKGKLKNPRKYISVHIKRELRNKSGNQCEFISPINGKRCESKHFLENEHQVPLAAGGSNEVENLRIYCRSHNDLSAKKWGISRLQ